MVFFWSFQQYFAFVLQLPTPINEDKEMWRKKLILNDGESLENKRSYSKGSLSEDDITECSVVNSEGIEVGRVTYRDHTSIKGFRRTESVLQIDADGKVLVDEHW
jgi:hypothetical protein